MTAVRALHDLSMDLLGALEDALDVEPGSALRCSKRPQTLNLKPRTLNPQPRALREMGCSDVRVQGEAG